MHNYTDQAGRVKLLLAGFALQLGQVTRRTVDDGETNVALFYSLELLVHISLPQLKPFS